MDIILTKAISLPHRREFLRCQLMTYDLYQINVATGFVESENVDLLIDKINRGVMELRFGHYSLHTRLYALHVVPAKPRHDTSLSQPHDPMVQE